MTTDPGGSAALATLAGDEPQRDNWGRRGGARSGPWYRRSQWWVGVGVAVTIALLVVVDLPTRANPAGRRADLTGFVSEVEADVAPCSAGLHDALAAYRDAAAVPPKLSPSLAVAFDHDGAAACSFASSGVVDLAGLQAPTDLASLHAQAVAADAVTWATLDCLRALDDLASLEAHPSAAARARVATDLAAADAERAVIERLARGAERNAGLPATGLPLASQSGAGV